MSPRPYHSGQREAASLETRSKILVAAQHLLASAEGPGAFTIDAVAKAAGVARMTVYYQFASKAGVMEAVFDALAAQGLVSNLVQAFKRPEPVEALAGFISTFAEFSAADRVLIRRIRSLALTDPEIETSLRAREERRRDGAREILSRFARKLGRPAPEEFADSVDLLFTLTSFETFDALISPTRTAAQAADLIKRQILAGLSLANEG